MRIPMKFHASSGGEQDSMGMGRVRSPNQTSRRACGGFTMVEIAICLAVIGFALVAIIGVLPIGMNVQKENREETIINFDANFLMNTLRSGEQDDKTYGQQSLTNYVIVITNVATLIVNGTAGRSHTFWYTTTNYSEDGVVKNSPALTNNAIIVNLLSKPKYLSAGGGNYWSNYVTADFRAITGSPMDQGTSQASKDFAFAYRVLVETIPSAAYPYQYLDPNNLVTMNLTAPGYLTNGVVDPNDWEVAKNRQANLNELRLRFRWPVLPGGKLGNGNQTYRTSASGALTTVKGPFNNTNSSGLTNEFRIQPENYNTAP